MDLGKTGYERLFKLLEPGPQSAEASFRICRLKLLKFFAWRRCADPSNLADETIVRLLKKVDEGRLISSAKPYSYVYGIADNVFREYCRARIKEGLVAAAATGPEVLDAQEPGDCEQLCLKRLRPDQRELLERYYLDHEDRQAIADEQHMSINALRLKIHRIKLQLARCCEDCQENSAH